jgi:hypothetical protein
MVGFQTMGKIRMRDIWREQDLLKRFQISPDK